jgi:hypothetical protein
MHTALLPQSRRHRVVLSARAWQKYISKHLPMCVADATPATLWGYAGDVNNGRRENPSLGSTDEPFQSYILQRACNCALNLYIFCSVHAPAHPSGASQPP